MHSLLVGNYQDARTYLIGIADAFDVRNLANVVLNDWRFPIWSGSSKKNRHHYGKHGLVIHTAEVVKLCLENNRLMGRPIEEKWLFSAALFHDAGKMWDYEPVTSEETLKLKNEEYAEWQGTPHKTYIHHISRSVILWNEAVSKHPISGLHRGIVDEVTHAILAHHQLREYGSPVSPNTQMAWMLHLCDGISARMNDANNGLNKNEN